VTDRDRRSAVAAAVADAHRREWAFVLAATARVAGSIDLAEECVQDAYGAALDAWLRDGVPRSPGAWLSTAARRRALDVLRREQTLRRKLPLLVDPLGEEEQPVEPGEAIPDDRLRLVFTCCHPALAREAQVAVTLRLVCGLRTDEIARGFLVSEPTMAARVTRAKKKISAAGIPYRVPSTADLPERLDAVLTVVHLLLTTGHTSPAGDTLVRPDLVERAQDLGRMLALLMPDEPEVRGMLALILLSDARRAARLDAIDEGLLLVDGLGRGRPGRFALQAAIAAIHARAVSWQDTDWPLLLFLYDALLVVWPSPVVPLNRAVAVLMVSGPAVALAEVEALESDRRLAGYRYLAATKADLLRRLSRIEEAAAAYREALALADNAAERAFLTQRLTLVTGE